MIHTLRPNVEQSSRDLLEYLALPGLDDLLTGDDRRCHCQMVTAAPFRKACSA
ncbi:MAG TPA: hypothetical protein PLH92_09480 [Mycobacterium sp.]|nr:hypothetical protein [Mycobacterium sp.]HQC76938.1 hypothetical protein [Mycobacterium sp.]